MIRIFVFGAAIALIQATAIASSVSNPANLDTTVTAGHMVVGHGGQGLTDGGAPGAAALKGIGTSVSDPGTGNLEALLPVQTISAPTKAFSSGDFFRETRRSNAGSAMADTFPVAGATGLVNGTRIVTNNVDATASLVITAGAETTINSASTASVGPGRSVTWVYDAANATWRSTLNGLNALLASNNLSEIASPSIARTNLGLAPVAASGNASDLAAGTLSSARLPSTGTSGTYTKVTTDAQGRVASGSALGSSDVTGALGFTPLSSVNWASPGTIGGATPNTGAFTSLSTTGTAYLGAGATSPATNGLEIIPSVSGQRPTIQFYGVDATRGAQIWSQGTGNIFLGSGTNNNGVGSLQVADCGATCTSPVILVGGTGTGPASISGINGLILAAPSNTINLGNGSSSLINMTNATKVGTLNITWSGTTDKAGFLFNAYNFGASTNNLPSSFEITNIDDMDSTGAANGSAGMAINAVYGGNGTTKGSKNGLFVQMGDNQGTPADSGNDRNYVAVQAYNARANSQGGTATTVSGAKGRVFGFGGGTQCMGNATNLFQCTGAEFDIFMIGSATTFFRTGLSVANLGSSATQGTGVDAGIVEYSGIANTGGFLNGLEFGEAVNAWPIDQANGTIVMANPSPVWQQAKAKWGVDWEGVSFPATHNFYDGGAYRSPGWTVDGAGNMRLNSCYFNWTSTGLTINCNGSVGAIANGAGAISSAGSGFTSTPANVIATDIYGGVYDMTISGGVVTSIAVETQPFYPSNAGLPTTINLIAGAANPGTGVTLIASWNSTASALVLNPSSTISFGTFTNTTCTNAGFITINDSGGTPRKVMICA